MNPVIRAGLSVGALASLLLSACGSASPSPAPTTSAAPPALPSPTAAVTETAAAPTQVPATAAPTPFVATATPVPLSAGRVPRPSVPISPQNASQLVVAGLWRTDTRLSELAFSPDGRWLAVTSSWGIHLCDADTLEVMRFIETERRMRGIAFSPDGMTLAAGESSMYGRIWLWRVADGELMDILELEFGASSVESVAFAPDGEILAAGTSDGIVQLRRLSDGEVLRELDAGDGTVVDVAFASDGSALAAGTDRGYVQLWRAADGESLHVLRGHRYDSPVAFAPAGGLVAVAGGSDEIELWLAQDGMPQRTLVGHTRAVRGLAFSPDGAMLVSAGADDTMRLWRVADGVLLYIVEVDVSQVAFSADGALLASTSLDRAIRFWGIDPSRPVTSPTPLPTTTPEPVPTSHGPFRLVTPADGLPEEAVRDLWVAPDGRLWVASEAGVFVHDDGAWLPVYDGMADRIVGVDDAGGVWAILNEGWRAAVYDGVGWTLYGSEQGWDRGYSDRLVTDRSGRVWMAVRDELRRFDPQTEIWTTLSAERIGFEPLGEPVEPGRALGGLAIDQAGNVWIGSCIYQGISIFGQGVRWFDGESWGGSADTVADCVSDIEVDDTGQVWMGGFDALIQYDPGTQAWSRVALPAWERTQLVDNLAIDSMGDPWVAFTRFGGAGPWHSTAIAHYADGAWVIDYDPGDYLPLSFAFDSGEASWICSEDTVLRRLAGEWGDVGSIPGVCREIVVDGQGRVWIVGDVVDDAVLWRFEP